MQKDLIAEEIDVVSFYMWNKLIERMDCNEAKSKKVSYFDKVFCNSFDRFPSDENVDEPEPLCDALKSAWFLELMNMDEGVLFDGEKEMIARMSERAKENESLKNILVD